jgi:hypothetical protein
VKKILTVLAITAALVTSYFAFEMTCDHAAAMAQPMLDAGPSSVPATVAPAPPTLHDPTTEPGGFWGDLQDVKSKGWEGIVLVLLYGLARLTGYLGRNVDKLKWLNNGFYAMIVAGLGTVAQAGADVVMTGGKGSAILAAMLVTLIGFLSPAAKSPAPSA